MYNFGNLALYLTLNMVDLVENGICPILVYVLGEGAKNPGATAMSVSVDPIGCRGVWIFY